MSNYTAQEIEKLKKLKAALDEKPMTAAMRALAEAGADYLRNKMGLPPLETSKKDPAK